MTSHYSRKNAPQKRFLNPNLNIMRMYNLYLEAEEPEVLEREKDIIRARQERRPIPEKLKPAVGEHTYRKVFNSEFNLAFGLPRSDTCATCDKLNLALKSDPGDTVTRKKLAEHQDRADEGYQSMRGDKKAAVETWSGYTRSLGTAAYSSKHAVDMVCFDFMQNLPTPNLMHNDVFYKRQLWTYVFGIHDMVVDCGYMYMWDETVANRGSSEVASCLSHFFETNRTGAKSLVSYSDGCGGQNKNLTVLGLYSDLHLRGVYDTLDHKFLTRGHTFLRNDSDFAQIERRESSAVVYLPSDWCKVVGEANRRNPFQVVQMKQTQFFNYKQHIEGKYTGRHIATGSATFLDVHWMNFGWGSEINPSLNRSVLVHHPNEVWMRDGYCSWESWRKIKIRKERAGDVSLEELYNQPIALLAKKVKDLKEMARTHVPSPQRDFYLNLASSRDSSDTVNTDNQDVSYDSD